MQTSSTQEQPGSSQAQETPPPVKGADKTKKVLICAAVGLVMIIIILIGAGVGLFLYIRGKEGKETVGSGGESGEQGTSQQGSIADSEVEEDEQTDDGQSQVTVLSPQSGDEVTGKITVNGKATPMLEKLIITLYDNNDIVLGESSLDLDDDSEEELVAWSVVVNVVKSPKTSAGSLKVAGGEDATEVSVPVVFKVQEAPGRIKLFTPLEDQVMGGTSVLFKGQMKNFFEGQMNLRLKDASGDVLHDSFIMASGDNYDQFADFEEVIQFGQIPPTAASGGVWELYEVSMMDGSEEVLLTVRVRLGV